MSFTDTDAGAEQRYRQLSELDPNVAVAPLLEALFDVSWRVRRLAAEKLAEAQRPEALVPQLLDILTRRGEPNARNAAATALGHLGAAAVRPLVARLEHDDPDQRKFAADILGALGRPEAAPALLAATKDGDLNVRVAALEALGRTGGTNAIATLTASLAAPEPIARVAALEALTALDTPPSLVALLPLLEVPATRRSAWRLLGRVRHRSAFLLIVRALRSPASRDAALVALGGAGTPLPAEVDAELVASLGGADAIAPWLGARLGADDREHRVGALHLVAALQLAELAPAVAEAAVGHDLAQLALTVLVRLGSPALVRLLEVAPAPLLQLSREARAVASEAVVSNASPRFVAPLVSLLDAGEPELAELSVRALGRSASSDAIAPLLRLVVDPTLGAPAARSLVHLAKTFPALVRDALARAVSGPLTPHLVQAWANVAGPAAAPELRRALHDESERVRAAGAQVAGVAPAEVAALLRMAVVDESARVRRAAARALSSVASDTGRPLLERLLHDPDASVLALAVTAAVETHATWAAPALPALSAHADPQVALAALEASLVFGVVDEAVLTRALLHPDAELVKLALSEAAWAPCVVAKARDLLVDPRWDVRAAAASALAVGGTSDDLEALRQAQARELEPLAEKSLAAALTSLGAREGRWPS